MAFIRRSGIARCSTRCAGTATRGEPLRVLTTTYTGSTERRALDQLVDLGADVRISYDLSTTRLHAKAWVFHRRSGFSTAYVGSSNLTHSAQVTGLEWNVRASAARNPDVVAKFAAVFDSYWAERRLRPLRPRRSSTTSSAEPGAPTAARASSSARSSCGREPFQERLLEQIERRPPAGTPPQPARRRDRHRQDGHGRARLRAAPRSSSPRARLLFVAHREEILDQSLATFRYALRDASFGEKWVGGARPSGSSTSSPRSRA